MGKLPDYFYRFLFFAALTLPKMAIAQCVFTSTNGYTVTVNANPVAIIAPATCPFGYNYNLTVLYNVSFSGTGIPSNLYTLQGNILCGPQPHFFSLPVTGGTGSVTTVSNPYINAPTCTTATIASLNCNNTQIIIDGPGITPQTTICAAAGPLPVTLISFNAMLVGANSVHLNWVTENETANKSFTVERSIDGFTWSSIAVINGAVNSSAAKQYNYTDADLAKGMYYYRLKQTNVSGTFTYSNTIGAKITSANSSDISLVQTAAGQLTISGLNDSKNWSLSIINTTGAVLLHTATLHSNTVQLPLVSQAIYIVKLQNNVTGEVKILKFFKI